MQHKMLPSLPLLALLRAVVVAVAPLLRWPLLPLPPRLSLSVDPRHVWLQKGSKKMCSRCWMVSRLSAPPSRGCKGEPSKLRGLLEHPNGHSIVASEYPEGVLLMCTRCGGCSEGQRLFNLRDTCKGPQSEKARANVRRLSRFMHPDAKKGDAPMMGQAKPLRDFLTPD